MYSMNFCQKKTKKKKKNIRSAVVRTVMLVVSEAQVSFCHIFVFSNFYERVKPISFIWLAKVAYCPRAAIIRRSYFDAIIFSDWTDRFLVLLLLHTIYLGPNIWEFANAIHCCCKLNLLPVFIDVGVDVSK